MSVKIHNRLIAALLLVAMFAAALAPYQVQAAVVTYCGEEEHTHSESCYVQVCDVVYSCSPDSVLTEAHDLICSQYGTCAAADYIIHTHDDLCFYEGELVCPFEEIEVHQHDDSCYTEEAILVCEEPEELGHSHSEVCYREDKTMVCDEAESSGHSHEDACYDQVLICGAEHEHGDGCFEPVLVCTLEETSGHTHTDDCYFCEQTLICGLEETPAGHIHDEELCCRYEKVLDCEMEEVIFHEHDDTCVEDSKLVCGLLASVVHQHSEDCRTVSEPRLELTCELKEHIHTDSCFEDPTEADSDLTCGLEEHAHDETCLDEFQNLICGQAEHIHVESCYAEATVDEPVYYCGLEEHEHTDLCFDGELNLVCLLEEHLHDDSCLEPAEELPVEVSVEEQVAFVMELIDALPTMDDIELLYELEDEVLLEQAMTEIKTAYAYYEEMDEETQALVLNADKLLDLSWFWSYQPLVITDTETIYQINKYSQAKNTLVWGGSVREKLGSGMSFMYWDAVIVDEADNGRYYVTEIITTNTDKRDLEASSSGGFIVLLYNSTLNALVGDEVTMDYAFTETETGAYQAAGYGTLSFGSPYDLKPDQDNTGKLTTVEGADTRDWIQVDLYNYGVGINTNWRADNNYPGFQQNHGVANVLNTGYCNFGDSITTDYADQANVTRKGGAINAIDSEGSINRPISDAMSPDLSEDGWPVLANGYELDDYFTENDYVDKVNTQSINGLFLHDPESGWYTFNSRTHHAQYDASDESFILYEQLITSNFSIYPFGNFLPFNDIVTDATQVSEIDREWYVEQASSAQWKADNGYGDEYQVLATALNKYISLMDTACGTDWVASDAMNEYFNSYVGNKDFDFAEDEEHLSSLYSIDFDEPTDFFFSMTVAMDFLQPRDGLTGKMGTDPMVFEFIGDDDVWCYVDGKLFLDLSGIHRHVGGQIDFEKGEVRYYELDPVTGDVKDEPYKTVLFEDLVDDPSTLTEEGAFQNYSVHKLKFFYTERGSGSGVYSVSYNFPLLRQNTISLSKEVSSDEEGIPVGDPDYMFQVLKAEDGVRTEELFFGPGTVYSIYDGNNKLITDEAVVDEDGIIRIKKGQMAVFPSVAENRGQYYCRELLDPALSEQYIEIIVNGSTLTVDYGIEVGSSTFNGVSSDILDIGAGNTLFFYNNRAERMALGALSITKEVQSHEDASLEAAYEFYIEIDDSPLAEGTEYLLDGVSNTVETAGSLTLRNGQTLTIPNLLIGTKFFIREELPEDAVETFRVFYSGTGFTLADDGESVSGVIEDKTPIELSVVNRGASFIVKLPATGSMGTYALYSLSILCLSLAVVLLIRRKNMIQ